MPAFFPRLYLVICGNVIVFGADFITTCPPRFIEDVEYSLFCQVNTSTVSAEPPGKCLILNLIRYQIQLEGSWSPLGSSNYNCSTSFFNNMRCVNKTSGVSTYEFRFTANSSYDGRNLRCWSDCLETNPGFLTSNCTNCHPVRITKRPPARHNCLNYVIEGHNLQCKCDGGIDTLPGVFRWADNSGSASLTLTNVSKSQHGTQYRCQAVWSGGIVESEDVYTLNVVYGPVSVSATVPDSFNTDGLTDMALNCSASAVNPSPTFWWTRQGSSDVLFQGQNYAFRPHPARDDGSSYQCHARNTISNVTRSANVTIHLNYPPTAGPDITNNSIDSNLYQGDTVTFTCTVTGGKPVTATSVELSCPGGQNRSGIVGSNAVSSSVTFNALSDSDHGSRCMCNTSWKHTDWYTHSVQATLLVYTPPSPPNITVTSGEYPPIAGETTGVTLTCVGSTTGRPAAEYTWLDTLGGQPEDRQNRSTLTFGKVAKENDGKTVTCKASNLYTVKRQPAANGTFIFRVYYHPVITLSTGQDSACLVINSTCEVKEGRKVSISCNADSNPAQKTITWMQDGGTHNPSSPGPDLNIVAANHTIHNGQYNCTVTTLNLDNGRQPLTSSHKLKVLVKYQPTKAYMTVNTHNNITVNENDSAVFECLANGRPTPYMELRSDSGIVGQPVSEGGVVLEDIDTWLNFTMTTQCHHTGVYMCTARNSVGQGPSDSAMLYVNCKPRAVEPVSKSVNFVGQAVQLPLQFVAYPLPHNFEFFYFGPADNKSSSRKAVFDNILQMSCLPTNVQYMVTCNVTVDNISSADSAGLYGVKVVNDHGAAELNFTITVFKSLPLPSPENSEQGAAVGGGIAGAAVVIGVAVVVLIRRQRQGSHQAGRGFLVRKTDGRTHRETEMRVNSIYAGESDKNGSASDVTVGPNGPDDEDTMIVNNLNGAAEGTEDETMIVNSLYGTAKSTAAHESQTRTPPRSDYEDVAPPPAAKPHVQPKPQGAAKMSTANNENNTYSVVQKGRKPVSNPADTTEYASVDNSKTAAGQNGEDAVRTGTTARNKSEAMQKPDKKPKPAKTKFKGKAQKEKKEDEQKLRKRPEHTEGAVYGNMPLSMNPIDCKVYENFGFQNEESETKPRDPPQKSAADQRSANKDGPVYTTIQFTEIQQQKAERIPPKREPTEYVSIVFNKQPLST